MLNEVISFIPKNRSINVVDATFGGGGYSKAILNNFKVSQLLSIDRDPISKIFSQELTSNFKNFTFINDKFSNLDKVINESNFKEKKYDVILYDFCYRLFK